MCKCDPKHHVKGPLGTNVAGCVNCGAVWALPIAIATSPAFVRPFVNPMPARPRWDDDYTTIPIASGDGVLIICNDLSASTADDRRSYGAGANSSAQKSLRRIELRRSDLARAGWRHGEHADDSLPLGVSALDAAYAQGIAACRAAIADAKYDAEKYGQPWSVSAVKVRPRE